ncbi:hypothetical protein [Streptomyces sp. NPDC026673]|uniref:hypothetical protein n=1 Tax=Streptomyces sp. NPDC026673 TaxID=3155724 RepID=UPI0033F4FDF5
MGRQEMHRKVHAPLKRAGLEVLEGGVPCTALPVSVMSAMAGCTHEETGRQDTFVGFDDQQLIEQANRGWYALATSFGLFDASREFLLALPAHRYNRRVGLLHDRVTSELACPVGRVGRMSLCPSPIRKSSAKTSCESRGTAARG